MYRLVHILMIILVYNMLKSEHSFYDNYALMCCQVGALMSGSCTTLPFENQKSFFWSTAQFGSTFFIADSKSYRPCFINKRIKKVEPICAVDHFCSIMHGKQQKITKTAKQVNFHASLHLSKWYSNTLYI